MSAEDIVARCTRDGVTSWQNVAAQIGCSVDQARKLHDPKYLNTRPWPNRCEEIKPAPKVELATIDETDMHSLVTKGPGKRAHAPQLRDENGKPVDTELARRILQLLERHGVMTSSDLAASVGSSCNSVRARLSALHDFRLVEKDRPARQSGWFSFVWRITPEGRKQLSTWCAAEAMEAA